MRKFIGNLRFIYVVLAVLLFCLKGHIAGLFTDKEKFYRKRMGYSGFRIFNRIKCTIDIEGLENLDPKKTYVFMGNHRSYTDILIVFLAMAVAKRDVAFMSKKEIFRVPFLGGAMKALGTVGIDRNEPADAFKGLIKAVKTAKHGTNLVIFPEGTRSADCSLQPFKRGGFILAVRAGLDIVPFVIKGSEKFMPKFSFAIYPAHVSIKYLPAISVSGLKDKEALALVEEAIRNSL